MALPAYDHKQIAALARVLAEAALSDLVNEMDAAAASAPSRPASLIDGDRKRRAAFETTKAAT